jgi:hypothetical protein
MASTTLIRRQIDKYDGQSIYINGNEVIPIVSCQYLSSLCPMCHIGL